MLKKLIVAVVLMMVLALPVLAEDVNQVVATVKGQSVTLAELDKAAGLEEFIMRLYEINPEFTQLIYTTEGGQKLLTEYRKQQLDKYVSKILLVMEAKARNLTLSAERMDTIFKDQVKTILTENNITEAQLLEALKQQGIASLDQYKEMFVQQNTDLLLIEELKHAVLDSVNASDVDIQTFYQGNQQQFSRDMAVHARHIVVESKEKAEELLAKLKAGADFVQLAKESSGGTSAQDGGDLGFIAKGQTVPEFDAVIFNMKVGEISNVVQTQYGFHIIKVEEIRPAGIAPLDEVKGEISQYLTEQKRQQTWDQFLVDLKKNANIEIKL